MVGRHAAPFCFAVVCGAGCDVVELNPSHEDAGGAVDADGGFVDGIDSGTIVDAGGESDAGAPEADAGPGPGCIFDDNPFVHFACEGDEDVCDPIGEVSEPAGDLVASWSRVEGDQFVVDVRFAAAPYRRVYFDDFNLLFERDTEAPLEGVSDHGDPLISQSLRGGLLLELQHDEGIDGMRGYPPPARICSVGGSVIEDAYDFCLVSLGIESPTMQFRIPGALVANADGSIRYAIAVVTPNIDDERDVSWSAIAEFTSSVGGAPDDIADLVGLCEIDCSDGAFP